VSVCGMRGGAVAGVRTISVCVCVRFEDVWGCL